MHTPLKNPLRYSSCEYVSERGGAREPNESPFPRGRSARSGRRRRYLLLPLFCRMQSPLSHAPSHLPKTPPGGRSGCNDGDCHPSACIVVRCARFHGRQNSFLRVGDSSHVRCVADRRRHLPLPGLLAAPIVDTREEEDVVGGDGINGGTNTEGVTFAGAAERGQRILPWRRREKGSAGKKIWLY